MTIKKTLLTTAAVATLFAFTVPVSFAECSTGCPLEKVKSDTCNTCSKCHKVKEDCGCKMKKEKKEDGCKLKDNSCPTGGAAPCKDKSKTTKQQAYTYPSAIYSNSNTAIVGENADAAVVADNIDGKIKGVFVDDRSPCETGGAAPILDESTILKTDCCPNPSIQSPRSMDVIFREIEEAPPGSGLMTGGASGVNQQYFPDVPESYWASEDIDRLAEQSVVVGYPDDLFKPNRDISRAELATMLVKGYNLQATPMTASGEFADVADSHWAHELINKSSSSNMMKGDANKKFHPQSHVTRMEALAAVSKVMSCPMDCEKANSILSRYKDGDSVPDWARESVARAIDSGALKDMAGSDTIRPFSDATRAEVSTMLQNMRIAAGLDSEIGTKTAMADSSKKLYIEKETPIAIPTLELEMKDIINSKNANVGEQFAAVTTHDITVNGVTYPSGSRVNGKITEIQRPNGSNGDGAIKLQFTNIVGCDGEKVDLPKQVLTAKVETCKEVNGFIRFLEMPFTLVGSTLGGVGRTVGGVIVGLGNASEGFLDQVGTGTGELFQGNFKASGRSYQDSLKTAVKAPVDVVRTAGMGSWNLLQNSGDEMAYLVGTDGSMISRVNPKDKVSIAFGNE